ncbi:MAG: hypothetical protein ABI851_05105 [Saprospiraceae bacterium]
MKSFIKIIPALLLGMPVLLFSQNVNFAEKVLINLYNANGNKIISRPKLEITDDKKNAAQFLRMQNTIRISDKLISICKSFGKDSSAALALCIGHELAHAYQLDLLISETSFLAYDKSERSDAQHEEAADIGGGFMAYLAGYKTLDLVEPLLDKLYTEFKLKSDLKGYPTLEDRKLTSKKVKDVVVNLIQLYELANSLTAIDKYDYALDCYESILQRYKGREIYNNIAVNYALLAMNINAGNKNQYIYPIELDWETRLKKLSKSRGELPTTNETLMRNEYLKKSIEYLEEAKKMDQNFNSADLNLMCVNILATKSSEVINTINKHFESTDHYLQADDLKKTTQLNLALAIAYASEGQNEKAKKIWAKIMKENNGLAGEQARINLDILEGKSVKNTELNELCLSFTDTYKNIDGIKIHRVPEAKSWIKINSEENVFLSIQNLPHSTLYTFKSDEGYFSLQIIRESKKVNIKSLQNARASLVTTNGTYYHCKQDKYGILLTENGKMKEWVKYN